LSEQGGRHTGTAVFRRDQEIGQPVALGDGRQAQPRYDFALADYPTFCERRDARATAMAAIELFEQRMKGAGEALNVEHRRIRLALGPAILARAGHAKQPGRIAAVHPAGGIFIARRCSQP
jgi:hypothetical protein